MMKKSSDLSTQTNQIMKLFNNPQKSCSYMFRTISRQHKPTWANKFVRDSYDLVYQPLQSLKNSREDIKIMDFKRMSSSTFIPRQSSSKSIKINLLKNNSEIIKNKKNALQLMKYQKHISPEKIQENSSPNQIKFNSSKNSNIKLGLSEIQFKNTILGKFKSKSNKHIQFNNQTNRPVNLNKIWYMADKDIEKNNQILISSKSKISRQHSFKSSIKSNPFPPKKQLDKYYDIEIGIKLTKPIINENLYDMQKVQGRKSLPKKQATQLQYDCKIDIIKERILSYKINKAERKLQFSKQIICDKRGASR